MDNVVTIVGNVGTAVDYRAGESGGGRWSRAEFRLASTRRMRRPDGEWVDAGTAWIMAQAWRSLADGLRDSVSKGDPVIVMGRLQTDEWTDDRGELRSKTYLVAEAVGHDLSRGRARFVRTVAIPEPVPATLPAAVAPVTEEATEEAGEEATEEAGEDRLPAGVGSIRG